MNYRTEKVHFKGEIGEKGMNSAAEKYLERMRQFGPELMGRESARLESLEAGNFKPLFLDIDSPQRICYIKVECKLCGKQYAKKSRSRIFWHHFNHDQPEEE